MHTDRFNKLLSEKASKPTCSHITLAATYYIWCGSALSKSNSGNDNIKSTWRANKEKKKEKEKRKKKKEKRKKK